MIRKDLKHIKLEVKSEKLDVLTNNSEPITENFYTAEGIELKKTYSEKDIEDLEFLDFGAGFALNALTFAGVTTVLLFPQLLYT